MKDLISCCGLDCGTCEAREATLANDDVMRAKIAEQWRVQYNAPGITPEMINCTGCRMEGVKIGHWNECKIHLCVVEKGYQTCGDCSELGSCALVSQVHQFAPQALENLKNLR